MQEHKQTMKELLKKIPPEQKARLAMKIAMVIKDKRDKMLQSQEKSKF
jgi:hypothetical protein